MEVGDGTMRRWMRDCHIHAPEKVVVANLRGKASALALASEAGRKRFAEFLKRHEGEVVILDPLAPVLASLGLDENSNADVSTFYSWWAEALTLAGIVDDVVVHHTGHAGQRSRGASRTASAGG
jgi:RecA-family ATPase